MSCWRPDQFGRMTISTRRFCARPAVVSFDATGFEEVGLLSPSSADHTEIAEITKGEYYYAGNAMDLKAIYEKLNARLVFETRQTEVSALFSAAAAIFATLAGLLSVLWFNRLL